MPFDLYPFQVEAVDKLADLPTQGLWMDAGIGKTATSTAIALYKLAKGEVEQVLVLVPPILITNWVRWLSKIPHTQTVAYQGTPVERSTINLKVPTFIVMSLQIFKKDYAHVTKKLTKPLSIILDEAQSVKNAGNPVIKKKASQNYKAILEFSHDKSIQLLSGTPISTPYDVYAYTKILRANIYRNIQHFEACHVAGRDYFGRVTRWAEMNELATHMRYNAVRILKEEVLRDLPEVTYTPIYYKLDSAHHKLYTKLANEQLLDLGEDRQFDATSAQKLYQALQQIILNWGYFAGEGDKTSRGLEVLDEMLEETDKLVVFTNYRMTNAMLTERLKGKDVRFIWGGSHGSQQESIDYFVNTPSCKALIMSTQAGGVGIDSLQNVCSDMIFLEIPVVPAAFHQAVARLHRVGQKSAVNVRIAVAEQTCVVSMFHDLLEKDQIIGRVVRNHRDLRDAIFGVEQFDRSSR
jgi:SNF2 family DNA or RNA helicase